MTLKCRVKNRCRLPIFTADIFTTKFSRYGNFPVAQRTVAMRINGLTVAP